MTAVVDAAAITNAAEDHASEMIGQLEALVTYLQHWDTPADRLQRAKMCADHAASLVKWLEDYGPVAIAEQAA